MNRNLCFWPALALVAALGGCGQQEPATSFTARVDACSPVEEAIVTTEESGGGCFFEQAFGAVSEICDIIDPDKVIDADLESRATMITRMVGLDALVEQGDQIGFGGNETHLSITVDLPGTIEPFAGGFAGFDIEVPGQMDLMVLQRLTIATLNNGTPTGDEINVGAQLDVGGQLNGGRNIAGVEPTQAFNQVQIRLGADVLVLDADDTVYVYETCVEMPEMDDTDAKR